MCTKAFRKGIMTLVKLSYINKKSGYHTIYVKSRRRSFPPSLLEIGRLERRPVLSTSLLFCHQDKRAVVV